MSIAETRREQIYPVLTAAQIESIRRFPDMPTFEGMIRDAGFTVYMPHIFGKDGAVPRMPGALFTMLGGCISRQFRACTRAEPIRSSQAWAARW